MIRLSALLVFASLTAACASPTQPTDGMVTAARFTAEDAKAPKGTSSQSFWVTAPSDVPNHIIWLNGALVTVTQAGYQVSGISNGNRGNVTLAVANGPATVTVSSSLGYCYTGTMSLPQSGGAIVLYTWKC